MNEIQGYFGYFEAKNGLSLYGVLHRPAAKVHSSKTILLVPPLFEERKSSYASMVQMARALCNQGHYVFRFDFRGSGESGGHSEQRTLENFYGDLKQAIQYLKKEFQGIQSTGLAILGLRFGGTLALTCEDLPSDVVRIALAPILKGKREVKRWRLRSKVRSELTKKESVERDVPNREISKDSTNSAASKSSGGCIDLDGFQIASQFLTEVEQLNLLETNLPQSASTFVLQLSHLKELNKDFQALQESLGKNGVVEAMRIEPIWERLDDIDLQPLLEKLSSCFDEEK